jgi:hypothetical protein
MTCHPYQLKSVLSGQLYKGLVAVPDQFGSDLVFAKCFNCSLTVWQTIFITRRLGLVLLFPNCTLLRAVSIEHDGLFSGVPPSMCFYDRRSPVFVTGTSVGGWTGVLSLRISASWAGVDPVPVALSTACRGPYNRTAAIVTPSRCYFAVTHHVRGWTRSRPGMLQWHFRITQSRHVVRQIHWCIVAMHDVEPQDELICDIGGEHPRC